MSTTPPADPPSKDAAAAAPTDPPPDSAPPRKRDPLLRARMQSEAEYDNEAYEAFKAAHGGKDHWDIIADHDHEFAKILYARRPRPGSKA